MNYKLFWTDEAIHNLEEILDYLIHNWTRKEVDQFKQNLNKQLNLILSNPKMFPVSTYHPRLRKAVLNKRITIFYEIRENVVYLAYIFVSYRDIENLGE